jgi:hypothetical protein
MIGKWLVWVARLGEVLALAKVGIQSHDYVLGARTPFNISRSVPCMSRAPFEQPVVDGWGLEQRADAEDVSSDESEKIA